MKPFEIEWFFKTEVSEYSFTTKRAPKYLISLHKHLGTRMQIYKYWCQLIILINVFRTLNSLPMMRKIICVHVYNVKTGVFERTENLIFVFGLKYRAACSVASTFRAENTSRILKNASTVHPCICFPISLIYQYDENGEQFMVCGNFSTESEGSLTNLKM
jgi:hypothetical protein